MPKHKTTHTEVWFSYLGKQIQNVASHYVDAVHLQRHYSYTSSFKHLLKIIYLEELILLFHFSYI